MDIYEGFNLPTVDPSTPPRKSPPTEDDVRSMKVFVETGCIPEDYFKKVAGSVGDGVAVMPATEECEAGLLRQNTEDE